MSEGFFTDVNLLNNVFNNVRFVCKDFPEKDPYYYIDYAALEPSVASIVYSYIQAFLKEFSTQFMEQARKDYPGKQDKFMVAQKQLFPGRWEELQLSEEKDGSVRMESEYIDQEGKNNETGKEVPFVPGESGKLFGVRTFMRIFAQDTKLEFVPPHVNMLSGKLGYAQSLSFVVNCTEGIAVYPESDQWKTINPGSCNTSVLIHTDDEAVQRAFNTRVKPTSTQSTVMYNADIGHVVEGAIGAVHGRSDTQDFSDEQKRALVTGEFVPIPDARPPYFVVLCARVFFRKDDFSDAS